MSDKPITRDRLLRILEGQAQKTASVIAGLDEETLNLPARDDGWTAKEILAHMASGHEGLLALAKGQVPGGIDPNAFDLDGYNEVQRRRAQGMSVPEVLAWLESARGRVRAYIMEVDEQQYDDVVQTPWMGAHPKGQFLMFPALHEGGHRAELARWREALDAQRS